MAPVLIQLSQDGFTSHPFHLCFGLRRNREDLLLCFFPLRLFRSCIDPLRCHGSWCVLASSTFIWLLVWVWVWGSKLTLRRSPHVHVWMFLVPSSLVAIGGSSSWLTDLCKCSAVRVFLDLGHACMCPGNSSVPYWPLLIDVVLWPSTFAQLLVDLPRDLVHRSIHSAMEHRSVTDLLHRSLRRCSPHVWSQGKSNPSSVIDLRHVVKTSS